MTNVLRYRARRFNALYSLLAGDSRSVQHLPAELSDHLLRDVGLSESGLPDQSLDHLRLGLHPIKA